MINIKNKMIGEFQMGKERTMILHHFSEIAGETNLKGAQGVSKKNLTGKAENIYFGKPDKGF